MRSRHQRAAAMLSLPNPIGWHALPKLNPIKLSQKHLMRSAIRCIPNSGMPRIGLSRAWLSALTESAGNLAMVDVFVIDTGADFCTLI